MAENLTLARPYAEAAFQLACGDGASGLKSWSALLHSLAQVASRPELQDCVGNPEFLPAQLARLCCDVIDTQMSVDQTHFVRVLADSDRLTVLNEIASLFDDLRNAQDGIRQARISSAFPMDPPALASLVGALERKFDCKVQATVDIDPQLIGGVRIALGDEVIDASVRGKLAAMASALRN